MAKAESSTGHEHALVPVRVFCSVAGHEDVVLVCPRCMAAERGRKGGASRSAAKLEAARAAAQAPRPAKYRPRKSKAES